MTNIINIISSNIIFSIYKIINQDINHKGILSYYLNNKYNVIITTSFILSCFYKNLGGIY